MPKATLELRRPRRAPRLAPEIELPELPPHWHVGLCECEPVVAYLRVSSAAGRKRIISPLLQFEGIERDSRQNNRRIVAIHFDLATGTKLEGRKVGQVVREIEEGQYRCVAVYNWSRWGRSTLESLQMCKLVDDAGGQVVSATEAFNTRTPTGEMIRDMLLIQAQWQSRLIGQNWKNIHGLRRDGGLPHTGRDRIGYVYHDRRYLVDRVEAVLLQDTYQRYVDGVSLKQLTREWNVLDIPTTRGGLWTPQALGRMLDTGFAAGYIRERSTPGKEPVNRLASYDVWRRGGHDAVIDEELWQRYRAKREAQAKLPPRLRRAAHDASGLVFCGLCARRMNAKARTGRARRLHWGCSWSSAYHAGRSNTVAGVIVAGALRAWIKDRLGQGNAAAITAEAQRLEDGAPDVRTDVECVLAKLANVEAQRDKVRDLFQVDSKMTAAKAQRRFRDLDDQERTLRVELGRAKAAERAADPSLLLPAFRALDEHWNDFTPEDRNAALREVVGMIQVLPYSAEVKSLARVRVVPVWEMGDWGDAWLASLRRR